MNGGVRRRRIRRSGGGFQPLAGEIRQIWALSGAYAWDVVGQDAVPPRWNATSGRPSKDAWRKSG